MTRRGDRTRSRRAIAAAAVAAAVVAAVSGCSGGQDERPPGPQGSVSLNISNRETQVLPAQAGPSEGVLIDAMWTLLVDYDPGTAAPRLAQAEAISTKDNRTWAIRLKPGWAFHDGTPVTATSYVKAWDWVAQCENEAANQAMFGPAGADIEGFDDVAGFRDPSGVPNCAGTSKHMSGLKVVDDLTFTVRLGHPQSAFESMLGTWAFAPMPKSFFANPDLFATHPIGNGPFRFESRNPRGGITLAAFDGYPGPDVARVARVEGRSYADLDIAYADLMAGRLDNLTEMPPGAIQDDLWKRDLTSGRYLTAGSGVLTSLTFPMYDSKFANSDLRVALSRAVNRESVIRSTVPGTAEPADSWAPPVVFGYSAASCGDTCRFDAAAAKDLLKKSGGFTGSLSIAYTAEGAGKSRAKATCGSITDTLAIPCEPEEYATRKDLEEAVSAKGVTGLFPTSWRMDYPSVQNFLGPLYGPEGVNDGAYDDTKFNATLAKASKLPTDQAMPLFAEAQRLLSADPPAIPLWFSTVHVGWASRVESSSIHLTPFSTVDLAQVVVAQ